MYFITRALNRLDSGAFPRRGVVFPHARVCVQELPEHVLVREHVAGDSTWLQQQRSLRHHPASSSASFTAVHVTVQLLHCKDRFVLHVFVLLRYLGHSVLRFMVLFSVSV